LTLYFCVNAYIYLPCLQALTYHPPLDLVY
jgi:hypothetical protein